MIAFPKSGTKSMNKVFTSLGYKVFDFFQNFGNLLRLLGRSKFLSQKWPRLFGKIINMKLSLSPQEYIGTRWLKSGLKQNSYICIAMLKAGQDPSSKI